MSSYLKDRISSPLEAGQSLLDDHHLPARLVEALEYASKRLAKKSTHIRLIVVRRDYQLPSPPLSSPVFTPGSSVITPSRTTFAVSRIDALKQLVRSSPISPSGDGQIRERILHVHHLEQFRNGTVSPAFSDSSMTSSSTISSTSTADSAFSRRRQWPGSPTSHNVPMTPATPFTPFTPTSYSAADSISSISGASMQSNRFGIRFVYAQGLSTQQEKALSQAFEKAAKKFKIGTNWLPQAVAPSALGIPIDLVHRSLAQNEAIFTSDSLTLFSLDHLYTFRTALQAYSRTQASCRLEDAVDDLRRLYLANGRRALRKSVLVASYRWLDPVCESALSDVCRMYSRAYGGVEREEGIDNDMDPSPAWPFPSPKQTIELEKELPSAPPPPPTLPAPPPPTHQEDQEQPAETPSVLDRWVELLNKEVLLDKELLLDSSSDAEMDAEEQLELDAIEAWYRDAQVDVTAPAAVVFQVDPLRCHPATMPVVEITPEPEPEPEAQVQKEKEDERQVTLERLEETRRATPKLSPAPVGRSLALKLQTTFDKPLKTIKKKSPTAQLLRQHFQLQQQQRSQHKDEAKADGDDEQEADDDDEEELTARPQSAVRTQMSIPPPAPSTAVASAAPAVAAAPPQRWNSVLSIDAMMLRTGTPGSEMAERLGPMTPNGYEDISPITRGEWGFLMSGKGRTVGVETC